MSPVFSHPQLVVVEQMRSLLAHHGIDAVLRNQYSAGASGELAPIDTWPELWLRREADRERALDLIRQQQRPVEGADWQCPACGAHSPATFDWCWQCGRAPS